jgi:predicted transcriptional regulator
MSELAECLSPSMRRLLDEAAQRVREHSKRTVESIIAIGRDLRMCRQALGSGEAFDAWINREFAWSRNTAYEFMRVAEHCTKFVQPGFQLDLSALYLLARPSTPQSIRDRALTHAKRGERVTHKEVRNWLSENVDDNERPDITNELVGKLRDIDLMIEDPAEIAAQIDPHLRPFLAERVQELRDRLSQLADALKSVNYEADNRSALFDQKLEYERQLGCMDQPGQSVGSGDVYLWH